MIRINLLPEEFHIRKRKLRITPHWGFLVAGVVFFFVVLFSLTLWQRSRLSRLDEQIRRTRVEAQRQRADLALVQELTELKERILERMQVVEQLNQNRTRWIEILTDLSASVPEDMWLMSFKEEQAMGASRARIVGMAFTLEPIALFMNNLNAGDQFSQPLFTYAQRIPVAEGMAYEFEIQSNLPAPQAVNPGPATSSGKDSGEREKEKQKTQMNHPR